MATRRVKKKIAYQSALRLLRLAYNEELRGDQELSKRYVEVALKLLQSVRVRMPTWWKRRICRNCYTILIPGRTCRVRIRAQSRRASHVTVTCLKCGWKRRYYIKGGSIGRRTRRVKEEG